MVKSAKYALGTRSNEIISIPIEIISVKLKDGILGPKLYLGEDGRKHIEDGYYPLSYNEEELAIILDRAWNRRRESLLANLDQLKNQIRTAGRVLDPIEVISNSTCVVLAEGHRRHMCARLLQLEGFPISTLPAIVYTEGYGPQGNYENFEYQMWFRNIKQPLTLREQYSFIQDKLNQGMSKEEFCEKVGISSAEFDTIMLIAGQSKEVRSLVEEGLISPTTLRMARIAADRKEWSQGQFEEFLQQSVNLANSLGKKKVSTTFMQEVIKDYEPEPLNIISKPNDVTSGSWPLPLEQKAEIVEPNRAPLTVPRLRVKPTAKEVEELFYEIMFCYGDTAVEENGEIVVYFSRQLAAKMEDYWNRVPEKVIEKLREKQRK